MTRSKMFFSLTIAQLFLLSGTIAAQEKQLQRSDLPAPVQKTADAQSKGATVTGYKKETEAGKPAYEVKMTINGHSKDVTIDPSGALLEIEEQVALEALPAAVRDGLQKKAGAGKITKVESITKHGTIVAYEAKVLTAGKKTEVQVGPDGKPLAHEE
jgi:DNA-binding protein YbaB